MPDIYAYATYGTDEFIRDEYFQDWVLHGSPEATVFWKRYLEAYPAQAARVSEAADFIRQLKFRSHEPAVSQVEAALEAQLEIIRAQEQLTLRRLPRIRRRRTIRWSGAAVLMALIGWAGIHFFLGNGRMITLTSSQAGIKTVILPDSSSVVLNASSELRWSRDFGRNGRREVWLKGEAFFNVRHDRPVAVTAAPFIVHAQDLEIAVLGTRFNVTNGSGFTNVILDKGRVKVRVEGGDRDATDLEPGELLRYTVADHRVAVRKVMASLYTSWKDQKMTLDKVPMSKLAEMIQDVYGDSVSFSDPQLASFKVSGTLQVTSEDALLKTLAFVLDISIDREDHLLKFTPK